MFKTLPIVTFLLAAALVFTGTRLYLSPAAEDPMCMLIGSIEPDAKCEAYAPREGKVTMPDKAEMYCKIKPKAGLVCNPTEPQRQAPAPQAPPEPGAGSGANAPKASPKPAASK